MRVREMGLNVLIVEVSFFLGMGWITDTFQEEGVTPRRQQILKRLRVWSGRPVLMRARKILMWIPSSPPETWDGYFSQKSKRAGSVKSTSKSVSATKETPR
jgi:hypothetical protein